MPPNRKVSETRWNRLVEYSELTLDGCWFYTPDQNGYTKEPEEKTLEPIPVPGITEEKRIENFAKGAPALGDRLIVMVDARLNSIPEHAIKFSVWIYQYIEILEKKHNKSWEKLQCDYKKGDIYLESLLTSAIDKDTSGLILADSYHPLLKIALPLFDRAGALIVR